MGRPSPSSRFRKAGSPWTWSALSEDRLDLLVLFDYANSIWRPSGAGCSRWSKHQELFGGLQDAKVRLDFLVACVFLSASSTVAWLVVLPIWAGAGWPLLAVAVLGLLLTRLFYLAAAENYVAFGELVRSSIDLYRFDLLDALRVARPCSLVKVGGSTAGSATASFGWPAATPSSSSTTGRAGPSS